MCSQQAATGQAQVCSNHAIFAQLCALSAPSSPLRCPNFMHRAQRTKNKKLFSSVCLGKGLMWPLDVSVKGAPVLSRLLRSARPAQFLVRCMARHSRLVCRYSQLAGLCGSRLADLGCRRGLKLTTRMLNALPTTAISFSSDISCPSHPALPFRGAG